MFRSLHHPEIMEVLDQLMNDVVLAVDCKCDYCANREVEQGPSGAAGQTPPSCEANPPCTAGEASSCEENAVEFRNSGPPAVTAAATATVTAAPSASSAAATADAGLGLCVNKYKGAMVNLANLHGASRPFEKLGIDEDGSTYFYIRASGNRAEVPLRRVLLASEMSEKIERCHDYFQEDADCALFEELERLSLEELEGADDERQEPSSDDDFGVGIQV